MNVESDLQFFALRHVPEVRPGDDVGALLAAALEQRQQTLVNGDIVVIAQKIISKAEHRLVDLTTITPSARAQEIAARQQRDPRLIEVILQELAHLLRVSDHVIIAETQHGFVCANAGVDQSNVPGDDWVSLLPVQPDESARRVRARLRELLGVEVAVIITDTFGRAWREGLVNVAIGVAGLQPLTDYRGSQDDYGRMLSGTVLAVADEIAAASGLLMRKAERVPVVVARGLRYEVTDASATTLIRARERDLFR
ncbi:MAG: coenzyme F420-0:L-glutamate ligase [Blastocatellia bacterium]